MQKTLFIIIAIFIATMAMTSVFYKNIENKNLEIQKENMQYTSYLEQTITGTDLATLINKAIYENDKNNVELDEKNHYIENDTNSIKIDIEMPQTGLSYPMEEFYNNDIKNFVAYFGDAYFKCTGVRYHNDTGRVSKMVFEQIENN